MVRAAEAAGRGWMPRESRVPLVVALIVLLCEPGRCRRPGPHLTAHRYRQAGWLSRNGDALAGGGVAERLLPAERGLDGDHAQVDLSLPPAAAADAAVFERGPVPAGHRVLRL